MPDLTSKPILHRPPRILGAATPGGQLTADPGLWHGARDLGWRWLCNGGPIPGATGPMLMLGDAQDGCDIGLEVTARGAGGQARAHAGARPVRRPPPHPVGDLHDEILDFGEGAVPLETAHTFTGEALRFSVLGSPAVRVDPGTGRLSLNADLPAMGECVTVTAQNSGGRAEVQFRLTVEQGDWAARPGALLPGQWRLDPAPGGGALTLDILALPETGRGRLERFEVECDGETAVLPGGTETGQRRLPSPEGQTRRLRLRAVISGRPGPWTDYRQATAAPRRDRPVFVEPPDLPEAPRVGDLLCAEPGLCRGAPEPELTFRWLRDGHPIAGAQTAHYRVTPKDAGRRLLLEVTAQNAAGSTQAQAETEPVPAKQGLWESDFSSPEDLGYWGASHRELIIEPRQPRGLRLRAAKEIPGNATAFGWMDFRVTPATRYKLRVECVGMSPGPTWAVLGGAPGTPDLNFRRGRSGGAKAPVFEHVFTTGPRQVLFQLSLRGGSHGNAAFEYGRVLLANVAGGPAPQPLDREGKRAVEVTQANTYFIDPAAGDNANDGLSPERPWKSYPVTALPGTRLVQKGGTRLRTTLRVPGGGLPEAPVIIDGNSDGRWGKGPAIIDGGRVLEGWQRRADGLYGAPWPKGEKAPDLSLYQDDVHMGCAQLPTPGDLFRPKGVGGFARATDMTRTTLAAKDWFEAQFRAPATLAQGAVVRVWGQSNAVWTFPILAYDPEEGRITFDNSDGSFKPYSAPKRWRFAIVNHPDCMAVPGQWYRSPDGASLVIRPFDDADPAAVSIDYPALANGIACSHDHVILRGFRITKLAGGRGISAPRKGQQGVVIERCQVDTSALYAGIHVASNRGARIVGNSVTDLASGRGIFLSGSQDSLVRGNRTDRIAGTQISLYGCRDCVVMGNRIGRRAKGHSNGMSFYMGNAGLMVVGNTIRMQDGVGIVMQDSRATNTIALNDVTTSNGFSVSFWRTARRVSNPQGGHFIANNTILARDETRAFFFQSATEPADTTVINNLLDGSNAGRDQRFDTRRGLKAARLIEGGQGYRRGDRIKPVTGQGNHAEIQVRSVDKNGAVTGFSKRSPGAYTQLPAPLDAVEFRTPDGPGRGARFAFDLTPSALRLHSANLILKIEPGRGLSMAGHRQHGNVLGPPPQRDRLLRDLSEPVTAAWDTRPAVPPAPVFSQGRSWILRLDPALVPDFPTEGLEVSHVGRYRPDGSDIFDWDGG